MDNSPQIYLNLPVKNLDNSVSFFLKLGFTINFEFTDEKAACIVVSENIYLMLLTEDFFKTFTKKEITDSQKSTEAIISLSVPKKIMVDEIVQKAFTAGGKPSSEKKDYGWMYHWAFQDLDNHLWEIFWLDPNREKTPK